ncbi:hypothetical protein, partial [Enterococcus faecalis]|uniref:hypothetical protein n=1 Tax=Enterococcus faecalis TaxID=1351 RepID=UPI0022F0D274
VGVQGWLNRSVRAFYSKLSSSKEKFATYLTGNERQKALEDLIKLSQRQCFAEEISAIEAGRNRPKHVSTRPLDIFLDENQVLRLRSRL